MAVVEKLELVSLGGNGGKNAIFFLQMARMILDVRSLIDWIQIKNSVKWYWECAASHCFNSQWEHTY